MLTGVQFFAKSLAILIIAKHIYRYSIIIIYSISF